MTSPEPPESRDRPELWPERVADAGLEPAERSRAESGKDLSAPPFASQQSIEPPGAPDHEQIAGASATDVEDVLPRDDRSEVGRRRDEHGEVGRIARLLAEREVEFLDVRGRVTARRAEEADSRLGAAGLGKDVVVEQRIVGFH